MSDDTAAAGRGHHWIVDEDTNGNWYRWCTRCHRFADACTPNEFHGPIDCDKPAG